MQSLQGIRPFAAARSALRASPVASSSRIRLPLVKAYSTGNDRYLIIRDFFTRQSAYVKPASTPIRGASPLGRSTVQSSFRLGIRHNSSTTKPTASPEGSSPTTNDTKSTDTGECPHCSAPPIHRRDHAQNYTPFIRRLIQQSSLPLRANYRPSKEELLGAASSWWERLRIRIKWFTIRGWRRFNTDDLSAFASWFVLGNTIWILIGTTTFVSAVFATLNSLSLQEYVARWISDYMTSETGVTVIFESAIVPRWGASTISFRNVYISRRPSSSDEGADTEASSIPDEALPKSRSSTSKPKPKTQTTTPPSPIPFLSSSLSPSTYYAPPADPADNYTMFDVNLDEVTVTLSFMRWLDGKGLIKDAKVKGVRGVIDRRSVWWDTSQPLIPENWRHEVHPGDFEFESLQVEDALLTIYQPGGQRPYNVSVFNAAIGPFRKRYLFYDMMAAEAITGQFDNCLFSLHMPQKLGRMAGVEEDGIVKRMARFRVDGLPIEHAQYATGHTGPISWITSGKVDAVLDIKFPFHPDEQVDFRSIVDQIGRNVGKISMGDHPDTAIPAMPALSQGLSQSQWQWQGEGRREGETEGEARARRERRRRATVLEERREIAREDAAREKQRVERQAAAAADAAEAVVQAQTKVEVVPLTSSAAPSTIEVATTNTATVTPGINPGNSRLARPPLRAPSTERESVQRTDIADERAAAAAASPTWTVSDGETPDLGGLAAKRQVTIDIDLRFRDLKAAVPLYTTDLSVTNNALIRPIVAFINANRTLVPIHCQVAADLTDFDGSWTLFETGLMSSISDQIYDALAHHVSSEAANSKRIRQVSMWGIQRGAEALLDTLRNVVDPVHAQLMAAAI